MRFPFRDTAKLCDLLCGRCMIVCDGMQENCHFFTVGLTNDFCLARNLYVCLSITRLLYRNWCRNAERKRLPLHSYFLNICYCCRSLCHINWCVFSEASELGFVYFSFTHFLFPTGVCVTFSSRNTFFQTKRTTWRKRSNVQAHLKKLALTLWQN